MKFKLYSLFNNKAPVKKINRTRRIIYCNYKAQIVKYYENKAENDRLVAFLSNSILHLSGLKFFGITKPSFLSI